MMKRCTISLLLLWGAASWGYAPVISLNSTTQQSSNAVMASSHVQHAASDVASTQSSGMNASNTSAGLTTSQRLTRLENQVNVLLPLRDQVAHLQQQVDQLQGVVDEQKHHIAELKKQLEAQQLRLASGPKVASSKNSAGLTGDASKAKSAYQRAYALLNQRHYTQALSAFRGYLNLYPKGENALDAHYWMGELYLIEGLPDKAIQSFQQVVQSQQPSARRPDALLKLGVIYAANGQTARARTAFQEVIKEYPNNPAKSLAQNQLKKIAQ